MISDAPLIADSQTNFAVYIHWPFCKAKCPYCDFNSFIASSEPDQQRWLEAYVKELQHFAGLTPNRPVTSIFFGGGTPSLMSPTLVSGLIETVDRLWGLVPEAEITLEANPTSVEAARFRGYQSAGVNRISLGVQSLNADDLSFFGREHSVDEALAAFDLARGLFDRCSLDLMYARPKQSLDAWMAELNQALALGPDHISLYQLTIEPNTRFASEVRTGLWSPLPDDPAAEQFEVTRQVLSEAGLPAYEVSNHARVGQESRHNLAYWRYQDYVGVGPGAHGRLTVNGRKMASRQHKAPEGWMQLVDQAGHATRTWETLSAEDKWQEALIMGLRLAEGLPLQRLVDNAELVDVWQILDRRKVEALVAQDDLRLIHDRLIATQTGIGKLDAILGAIAL